MMQVATDVAVPITSHADLVAAFDARRRHLKLTHEELSDLAGLPDKYSGKVACGLRGVGPLSFAMLACALGLELIAYPEPDDEEN